jgi:hypothetical protein
MRASQRLAEKRRHPKILGDAVRRINEPGLTAAHFDRMRAGGPKLLAAQ